MKLSCRNWSPVLLRAGDIVLGLFLFFPCHTIFWRGAWNLMDEYILPGDIKIGSWISFAIGITGRLFISAIQEHLEAFFHPQKRPTARRVFIYFFNFFYALIVINHWRGLWTLLDCYLGYHDVTSNTISLAVSLVMMWLLRCSNTALSAPFYCVLDSRPDFFVSKPRFGSKPTSFVLHFLDQLFSLIVCYSSAIVFWRAVWNLQDDFILPQRDLLSDVVSLITGYITIAVLLVLERPAQLLAAKLDGKLLPKLLEEDLVTLVGATAVIFLWRGLWNMFETYVLPDMPVGGLVSMAVGGVPLWIAGCASSLYDITMTLDGGFSDGEGCTWDIHYLQAMFRTEEEDDVDPDHKEPLKSLPGGKPGSGIGTPEEVSNGWARPYSSRKVDESVSSSPVQPGIHASYQYIAFMSNLNCSASPDVTDQQDLRWTNPGQSRPEGNSRVLSQDFSLKESAV